MGAGISPVFWWIGIFVVMLLVELLTVGLTTIWFAGGALVAALAAYLGAGTLLQVIVFLAVSILLLIFTRPIAVKYLNRTRTKTNADSLVGQTARVVAPIDNFKDEGKVSVNGMEWTARSEEDGVTFDVDALVEIRQIQGVKLIVKPYQEAKTSEAASEV